MRLIADLVYGTGVSPGPKFALGVSCWCGGADTATKSRDKSASLGVERADDAVGHGCWQVVQATRRWFAEKSAFNGQQSCMTPLRHARFAVDSRWGTVNLMGPAA